MLIHSLAIFSQVFPSPTVSSHFFASPISSLHFLSEFNAIDESYESNEGDKGGDEAAESNKG